MNDPKSKLRLSVHDTIFSDSRELSAKTTEMETLAFVKSEPISDDEETSSTNKDKTTYGKLLFDSKFKNGDDKDTNNFANNIHIKTEITDENLILSTKGHKSGEKSEKYSDRYKQQLSVLEWEKALFYNPNELSEEETSESDDSKSVDSDREANLNVNEMIDFNDSADLNRKRKANSGSGLNTVLKSDSSLENSDEIPSSNNKGRKYKCCLCTKKFKLKHHLDQHILTHTFTRSKASRKYSCSICDKKFKLKHHFERHMLTHTKEKKFQCALCNKSYVAKYDLQKHIERHNKEVEPVEHKIYTCETCGRAYETETRFKQHKFTHNKECGICGKVFLSYRYLRSHLRVHAGMTAYSCDICGKLFSFKAAMSEHLRIHTGEKPYECEVCGKTFATKSNQVRHMKSHFQTRSCKYCGTEFVELLQFREHVKKCPSKYKCDKCNWSFTKKSNFRRHLETHAKYSITSGITDLTPEFITIENITELST